MKESDFFSTGTIECKRGTAVFSNDNYTFSFLNALSKKPNVYDERKLLLFLSPTMVF